MANLILPRRFYNQPSGVVRTNDYGGKLIYSGYGNNFASGGNAIQEGVGSRITLGNSNDKSQGDILRKGFAIFDLRRTSLARTDWATAVQIINIGSVWYSDLERCIWSALDDGSYYTGIFSADHNVTTLTDTSIPFQNNNTRYIYMLAWDFSISSAWATLYRDGVSIGSAGIYGTFPWNTGNARMFTFGNLSLGLVSSFAHVFSWDSNYIDIYRSFINNPWQIFRVSE